MGEERGVLAETIGSIFGHGKDEPLGVKGWKVSTLGPSKVGKTVLISGLYAEYHMGTEHGKAIGIESIGNSLHTMLSKAAKGLRTRPAEMPEQTTEIYNAKLKFLIKPQYQTYQKIISLQDHAGEHLRVDHAFHDATMESLRESDSFMIFLDSNDVLAEDYHDAAERMHLNTIKSLIREISYGLHDKDIIPIAVAFSKADTVKGRESELLSKGVNLFAALSEELERCVFCFSPVSVIRNAKSDEAPYFIFSPYNAEIPFLFCIASVVVRNAAILSIEADRAKVESREVASTKVEGGFFQRIRGLAVRTMEARRLDLKSKRYVSLSKHDISLAESALEKMDNHENVTFLQDGVVYDDVHDLMNIN